MQFISSLIRKQKPRRPEVQPAPVLTEAGTTSSSPGTTSSSPVTTSSSPGTTSSPPGKKLVFLGDENHYGFDLEDLLRASAEVLGKGSTGTSYKAVLEQGSTVAIKRLRDVVSSQSELETHIGVLGRVRHHNLVPVRAYYFSEHEKLLVSDYIASGNLSSRLHGVGVRRSILDWETRKKIASSTAEGISHLHTTVKLVHGNIKSANVFLGLDGNVLLSDYGLNASFGSGTPPNRVAGYCAPEILETREVTYQSDVYSFGILLLELLTGKSPNKASLAGDAFDLPRWVLSMARGERTSDVFDPELTRYNSIDEEMVALLEIALMCVSPVPEQRPNIQEVICSIDYLNRGKTGDVLGHSDPVMALDVDLDDLVMSWNNVLGIGTLGISYKAGLKDGTVVTVKKLHNVAATKSEFESRMRVLANIRHENVAPLKAYYFTEAEKWLVFDYMPSGSLCSSLHGGRGSGQASLDWEKRKNIALNAAKGIAHLHTAGKIVHGNIKSSNVLLSPDHDVSLSDFGLNALVGSAPPPNRLAGYSAPEISDTKNVTFQSDIYSLGILLLELLTGKVPNQASLGEGTANLPAWVRSVGRDEWTTKVFDAELTRDNEDIAEMVSLLQIAMACVSNAPDQRPAIQEVVSLIENLIMG